MNDFIACLRYRIGWPFIGWIACFSPLLLLVLRFNSPHLLDALMLLRAESNFQAFSDSMVLTVVSLMVSAFGIKASSKSIYLQRPSEGTQFPWWDTVPLVLLFETVGALPGVTPVLDMPPTRTPLQHSPRLTASWFKATLSNHIRVLEGSMSSADRPRPTESSANSS